MLQRMLCPITNDLRRAFDSVANDYDAWFDANAHAYASELEAVRQLFPRTENSLEIGVGTGRFASPLGIRHGVEPSAEMGRIARGRGIDVKEATAQALPYEDECFDSVLICTVFCFVKELGPVLREARRVLRRGGVLVLAELDKERPLVQAYDEHKEKDPLYRFAHFHTAREFAAGLEEAGLTVTEKRQTIFGDPSKMDRPDPVREGHGEGAFIVFRAERR